MTRVLGRVGLAAALVVSGTAVATPPPAQAASAGSILLIGSMYTGPGMSYPCVEGSSGLGVPQVNVSKCAGPLASQPNLTSASFAGMATIGNAGSWTGANTVDLEAGTLAMNASGIVSGACELNNADFMGSATPMLSVGNTARGRTFYLTWTMVGGIAVVRGLTSAGETFAGTLHVWPSTGTCLNKQPKIFTVAGELVMANREANVPPVIVPPLPVGGAAGASNNCTSGTIHEGTTAGVFTRVRVQAVDARTTWVCVRAASGATGYGGQFVITAPSGAPSVSGTPTSDALSGYCTTTAPNGVPGPHPLAAGQIGDPGGPAHAPYLIDSYTAQGQAWVCLQAGTTNVRVIVPLGAPSVGGLPSVTFNADPGTPDPL